MAFFSTMAGQKLGMGLLEDPREKQRILGDLEKARNVGGGFLGGDWTDKLARAAAFAYGDFDTAADISQGMRKERMAAAELAQKAQAQQQAIETVKQASPGITDAQAAAIVGNHATMGDFVQRPKSPPALQQNFEWWKGLDPQSQQQFRQYQDVVRPRFMTGPDGLPYQMPTQGGGPQPGTVEDNHMFMGGDPGDPTNWRAVDNVGGEYLPIPRLGGR